MPQKILVVEDDHNLRSDLVSYLQLKGYTSLGAATCREIKGKSHTPCETCVRTAAMLAAR